MTLAIQIVKAISYVKPLKDRILLLENYKKAHVFGLEAIYNYAIPAIKCYIFLSFDQVELIFRHYKDYTFYKRYTFNI